MPGELKDPIFLVGLPRSGTTLWQRIFANSTEVAVFTEMHFLTLWRSDFRNYLREVGPLTNEDNVRQLVAGMFADPLPRSLHHGRWFWRKLRTLESVGLRDRLHASICISDKSIGAVFRCILEEATRCSGRNRCVVRFPVHPVHLPKLVQWYPEARIVHLTRDPRAIATSKANDPGGTRKLRTQFPAFSALWSIAGRYYAVAQYVGASRVHARFKDRSNYKLFQYEDLMIDPISVLSELCEFCQIRYEPAMLSPKPGQASSISNEKAGGMDRLRATQWRSVISPFDAALIKLLTSRSMSRMGYFPDQHPIMKDAPEPNGTKL